MNSHEQLKQRTASLHHRLDHQPMMQRLLSPALDVDEYASVMKTLAAWFTAIEGTFFSTWSDLLTVIPKAGLIEQDLAALGHNDEPINPLTLDFPTNACRAFALGVLYVCEGSTLGGQIIGPRVSRALQRNDVTHYYQCYGNNTRPHWQSVLTVLETYLQTPEDMAQAIAGAQWAFNSLIADVERAQTNIVAEAECTSA